MPSNIVILTLSLLLLCNNVSGKATSGIFEDIRNLLSEMEDEDYYSLNTVQMPEKEATDTTSRSINLKTRVLSQLSPEEIKEFTREAIEDAKTILEKDDKLKLFHFNRGNDAPPGGSSPNAMATLNNLVLNLSEIEEEEREAVVALLATELLIDRGAFSDFEELRSNTDVAEVFAEKFHLDCVNGEPENTMDCSSQTHAEFRTISGVCNNLRNPMWGAAATPQIRLLDPAYEDGFNSIRRLSKSPEGKELPSPRQLSSTVLRNASDRVTPDDPIRTIMVMLWGQFLDHDITETPMSRGAHGSTIACCSLSEKRRAERSQCAPIKIDPGTDPRFNAIDCMDFVRSSPARSNPCKPGVRDQLNAVTGYIDGSQVYGSENELAHQLRVYSGGLLKVDRDNLPPNNDSFCLLSRRNTHCLLAGDVRVNENPALTGIHTAFVLYHNYLADRFVHEGLTDDETIYQKVRKIIGAIMQHITYSVWLPDLIGQRNMNRYGLTLQYFDTAKNRTRYRYRYRRDIDPSIQLPFSTAALRLGHTLVSDSISLMTENYYDKEDNRLFEHFFRPDLVFQNLPAMFRWIVSLGCKKSDAFFTSAIHDHLYENFLDNALDLPALNIQRARDHGLPGYVQYREWCRLSVPKTTDDLKDHSDYFKQALNKSYAHIEDIDLYVGAMTENNVNDGNIGPTFSCLLGTQFRTLKLGDRFWFEQTAPGEPTGLTTAQRDNIKKVKLAKIICEVFGLSRIQENVFRIPRVNEWKPCSELDDIDVRLWLS